MPARLTPSGDIHRSRCRSASQQADRNLGQRTAQRRGQREPRDLDVAEVPLQHEVGHGGGHQPGRSRQRRGRRPIPASGASVPAVHRRRGGAFAPFPGLKSRIHDEQSEPGVLPVFSPLISQIRHTRIAPPSTQSVGPRRPRSRSGSPGQSRRGNATAPHTPGARGPPAPAPAPRRCCRRARQGPSRTDGGRRNRRTVRHIVTGRPPVATSASCRWYRSWTQCNCVPQPGHRAVSAVAKAVIRPPRTDDLDVLYGNRRQMRQQHINYVITQHIGAKNELAAWRARSSRNVDQRHSRWPLSGGEPPRERPTAPSDRSWEGRRCRPGIRAARCWAPAACWWARHTVESTVTTLQSIRLSTSASAWIARRIRSHVPSTGHRR